ncbi:MAG: hypothetical protein ACTSVY_07265 [Candidatus Helarchaeota archaeon]
MKVNLFKECKQSKNNEFYYGTLLNKEIKDVYLGCGFLSPREQKVIGPGGGHEEIILLLDGEMMMSFPKKDYLMKSGDAVHLPDGLKVEIENLTDKEIKFVIAGGHVSIHSH